MKNTQGGFIGIAIVILITLVVVGGGAYVYTHKEVKVDDTSEVNTNVEVTVSPKTPQSPEIKTEVKTEIKSTVSLPAKSLKTFTQSAGIYSVSYPSTWTYSEGELSAQFQTVTEGASQTFDIGLGEDIDYAVKTLSQQNSSEKITFGTNTFTKFTRSVDPHNGHMTYILPIGTVNGKTTYLSILVEVSTKINTNDFNSFLASIKLEPSKAIAIVKRESNIVISAQIRSYVANIRANAEIYFDTGNSYTGMCNASTQKSKDAGIDKILDSVLKLVSSNDVYCNASPDAFVYSVRMPSGDMVCSDSAGFSGTIIDNAKTLSCK